MTTLFNIVFCVYLLAVLAGAIGLFSRRRAFNTANLLLMGAGAALHVALSQFSHPSETAS